MVQIVLFSRKSPPRFTHGGRSKVSNGNEGFPVSLQYQDMRQGAAGRLVNVITRIRFDVYFFGRASPELHHGPRTNHRDFLASLHETAESFLPLAYDRHANTIPVEFKSSLSSLIAVCTAYTSPISTPLRGISYLVLNIVPFIAKMPHVSKESIPGSWYPKSMITARLSWLVAMIRR